MNTTEPTLRPRCGCRRASERRRLLRALRLGNLISWAAVENLFTGVPLDPGGSQVDRSDRVAPPGNPFWARMGAEITRQPVRVIAACLATVLAPAVVASASSADPPKPTIQPAPVPVAGVGPAEPGDTASWLAVARLFPG